ncbi:MAG: hypothetical protein Q9223_001026 [Gallowayella weberi]
MALTYTIVSPPDPALTPPPGVIPDFQDPFSLRPYWIVATALGLIATGFLLTIRLYTKVVIVRRLRWEDYTCAFGFLFFAIWIAFNFKAIDANAGAHQWNLTERQMAQQYKFYNYSDIFYSLAVGLTKISILLLVLRIFCPKKRDPFYWTLQSLNICNTIFYAVFFFIPIFQCKPREKIWLPKTPGKCLDIFGLYIASSVFNIISDLAMYFIPLWKVWHLQISKARKLGISTIFATGSLAIISSIFRLVFAARFLLTEDFAYVKVQAIAFTLAELAFGLICSCIFVLPRLYRHLASGPPRKSEEYELRKSKMVKSHAPASGQSGDPDGVDGHLKTEQEGRNVWENDVEDPVAPATNYFRAGIESGWQKMKD